MRKSKEGRKRGTVEVMEADRQAASVGGRRSEIAESK